WPRRTTPTILALGASRADKLATNAWPLPPRRFPLSPRGEGKCRAGNAPRAFPECSIAAMDQLWLKPGKERSLARRHPWIYATAVSRIAGSPGAGDMVAVHGAD